MNNSQGEIDILEARADGKFENIIHINGGEVIARRARNHCGGGSQN